MKEYSFEDFKPLFNAIGNFNSAIFNGPDELRNKVLAGMSPEEISDATTTPTAAGSAFVANPTPETARSLLEFHDKVRLPLLGKNLSLEEKTQIFSEGKFPVEVTSNHLDMLDNLEMPNLKEVVQAVLIQGRGPLKPHVKLATGKKSELLF